MKSLATPLTTLVLFLGITCIEAQPCVGQASPPLPKPSGSERDMKEAHWQRLWSIGGSESDTLLLYPTKVAITPDITYVLDPGGPRVLALDTDSGELRWSFGRKGHGPGEFSNLSSLAIGPLGVWLGDSGNHRLTLVSPYGKFVRSLTLQTAGWGVSLCRLQDGTFVVSGPTSSGALTRFGQDGKPLPFPRFPFKGMAEEPLHLRSGQVVTLDGGCLVAAQLMDGFSLVTPDGIKYARRYIEPYTYRLKEQEGENLPPIPEAGSAIAIAADTSLITIAYDGISPEAGRIIDFYDSETGTYQYSVLAPQPPVNRMVFMGRVGSLFAFVHGINLQPAVSVFRLSVQGG